jgi:hypothetical protein
MLPLWLLFTTGCVTSGVIQPTPLRVGQEVRLEAEGTAGERLEGTVVAIQEDVLTLQQAAPIRQATLPLEAVRYLAIKTGRERHVGAGALIGLGAGMVFSLAIDAAEGGGGGGYRTAGIAIVSGSGLVLGTLLGLMIQTDRWEEQPVPPRLEQGSSNAAVSLQWSLPLGRETIPQTK